MGLHKTQNLLQNKRNNKMKRQPIGCKEIFVNYIPVKDLKSKKYKELI